MTSTLDRIKSILENLLDGESKMHGVYYGVCTEADLPLWNYFVFRRLKTTKNNASKMDYQTFYEVNIVHEDYIPERYVEHVVRALEELKDGCPRLKATNDDISYTYATKGNTDVVVEIATLTIYRPEKRI